MANVTLFLLGLPIAIVLVALYCVLTIDKSIPLCPSRSPDGRFSCELPEHATGLLGTHRHGSITWVVWPDLSSEFVKR